MFTINIRGCTGGVRGPTSPLDERNLKESDEGCSFAEKEPRDYT